MPKRNWVNRAVQRSWWRKPAWVSILVAAAGVLITALALIVNTIVDVAKPRSNGHLKVNVTLQTRAPQAGALHQLPPPPRDFTGRTAELRELRQAARRGGVIIAGMPGVGKTALALKLAEELTPHYRDAQIFLDLKGTSREALSPAEAMAHVILAFCPEATIPEREGELCGLYRSVLDGKRALLLMDNVADARQVEPLTPPRTCILIVTSRQHFALPGMFSLNLDALPISDARDFLLKIAPRVGETADEIARLCGHLPIALRAAGSLLGVTPDLDPREFVRALSDERHRLERLGTEGVEVSVEASFGLSYQRLPGDAAAVFRKLAVFPGSFDALAEEVVCEDAEHRRLSELVRRSLVQWDEKSKRYRLHDLVRLFAESRLAEDERQAGQQRHAKHYATVLVAARDLYLEGGDRVLRGLELYDREQVNIQAGQKWAAAHAAEDHTAALLCNDYPDAGSYVLNLRLHPRERIAWLEAALDAAQRLKDRKAEGVHLGNLGSAYADLGETRKAIRLHQQALAICREIGDRRGEGADLGSLGNAYADLGETRKAIEFHEQDLGITREVGDRRGVGVALGNLGTAYQALGKTRKAIEFYEQALAIGREIGDRQGEGRALGNLGVAYKNVGETRRAIELYKQQLVVAREIRDRRSEGSALGNLGVAYGILGNYSRAVGFFEQEMTVTREAGDRGGEGNALWNMSLALEKLGQRDAAVVKAEAAAGIFEEIEDPAAEMVRRQLAEWRKAK